MNEELDRLSHNEIKQMNLYQRMHAVMCAIESVNKDGYNQFTKQNYASHDSVTRTIKPFLEMYRLMYISTITKTNVQQFTSADAKGKEKSNWFTEVWVQLKWVNIDNPEENEVVESYGQGIGSTEEGAGKGYSYAVKYAVLKSLNLPTGEDADKGVGDPNHRAVSQKKRSGSQGAQTQPATQTKSTNPANANGQAHTTQNGIEPGVQTRLREIVLTKIIKPLNEQLAERGFHQYPTNAEGADKIINLLKRMKLSLKPENIVWFDRNVSAAVSYLIEYIENAAIEKGKTHG